MATLHSKNSNLRALEPEDLDFLFSSENDESFWEISGTQIPYSKYILQKYIENDTVLQFFYMTLRVLPTLINAFKAFSRCSLVCAAESCTLILAFPLATTG